MSAGRHEEEHHLTPAGWVNGSQKVYDNETKTVPRPVDAVLTIVKDSTEFEEDIVDLDEDDSEISGDCNESQPCRGDEAWLPQDLDDHL